MTSTSGEISPPVSSHGARTVPTQLLAVGPPLVGALLALVLGLLTFGVQATVGPHHLPLAVGAAESAAAPALASISGRVTSQGGDAVRWHAVNSRQEAEGLLDRKEVYGAVLFSLGTGGLTATVLLSGAVNPVATQAAESILTQVANNVTAAARAQVPAGGVQPAAPQAPPAPPVQTVILHPASPAGRTLPLAASALLWLTAVAANALVIVLAPRTRSRRPGRAVSVSAAVVAGLFGSGVVLGLALLWDSGLPISWEVAGFLWLAGAAFGLFQAGILRWLGLPGIALLGALYLMAPAVAALPPELLNPIYRAALWSWTPFRFTTEGLRSLLYLGSGAQDVQTALWVCAGLAAGGLLLIIIPKPGRPSVPVT